MFNCRYEKRPAASLVLVPLEMDRNKAGMKGGLVTTDLPPKRISIFGRYIYIYIYKYNIYIIYLYIYVIYIYIYVIYIYICIIL